MPELIDIVDEDDNVIDVGTRAEKERTGFISRNVIVVLKDYSDNYILTVRDLAEKSFPGCYQFAACGDVHTGEDYLAAAQRELQEELGITCELRPLTRRYSEVVENGVIYKYIKGFFFGIYNGDLSPSDEIERVEKIPSAKVDEMVRNRDKTLPDYFLEEYRIVRPYIQ